MNQTMKILIVDDEADIRETLTEILQDEGYKAVTAPDIDGALNQAQQGVDLALVDIKLGEDNGIDLLKEFKKIWPRMPVVMISGHGTVKLAARAFKLGAYDFLEKPLRLVQVRTCVRNALAIIRLQKKLAREAQGGNRPIFTSPVMTDLFGRAAKLSRVREPVLVLGPSGSGKELVARALHYEGSRADGPLVITNAASMPVNLAEDELFGHVKGAFTGADRDRAGCLEQADGGTLFLDEIADLPAEIQAKLLRVLEDGTFSRLGETSPRRVDVRLVCATHKDLEALVSAGTFREDLWFRISAFILRVAPLSDRREDIPLLADHFLEVISADMGITKQFSQGGLNAVQKLSFPGNVRELKHTISRLAVYSPGDIIDSDDVAAFSAAGSGPGPITTEGGSKYSGMDFRKARDAFEKEFLKAALSKHQGNITATAGDIGMAQSNLSRKLKELGLR